ncbi:hypothetical protein BKA56DRAFT_736034 [Ilyonectria sp. MPI-CAGE-AT-0026]|nr:hypothetical protein BKA56DRAFT_736034 [Ilyonectria sp. MPI-CAGE-AT-0026]
MVRIYGTGTRPVNGPDDPFVLTRDQLWEALERKQRHPEEFVAILSNCKVLKDENGVVEREATLNFGKWGVRHMHEIITTYGDLWIRFVQADGSVSTNIVSFHSEVSDTNLMLTYVFEWEFPSIQAGTSEHKELTKDMSTMAIAAVTRSIERARELVTEGKIK